MYEKNNIGLCLAAIDLVKQGGAYSVHSRVGNEAVADCQGFVELALQAIGIDKKDYTGSNAMIRQMVHSVKTVDSAMLAGDMVFWVRHDDKEHAKFKFGGHRYVPEFAGWNATHIGIYLGNGYIAESASSIGHWAITELKKRKPTHYAKHNALVYVSDEKGQIMPAIELALAKVAEQAVSNESAIQASANIAYVQYKQSTFQNLRAAADSKSAVLAEMPTGSQVKILEKPDIYGWVKVRFGNLEGYMSERAYKKSPPAGVQVTVPAINATQQIQEYSELRKEIEELKLRMMELENFVGMGVG